MNIRGPMDYWGHRNAGSYFNERPEYGNGYQQQNLQMNPDYLEYGLPGHEGNIPYGEQFPPTTNQPFFQMPPPAIPVLAPYNLQMQEQAYPSMEGPSYPPNAGPGYPSLPGSFYPPNAGQGYPSILGPPYPPNAGPGYPSLPGSPYLPNTGQGYPSMEGPTYPPNAGQGYPQMQGKGFNPFENPLAPAQKKQTQMNILGSNPYPKQQFMQKQQPTGVKSVLNQFKTQDGSMDINKMMNTAGQMMNTFGQVSTMVKGVGGIFKI